MPFKNNQSGTSRQLNDGSPLPAPSSSMGLDVSLLTPRKLTLKISGEVITVTSALGYGSLELLTLQDRNIHVLGMEVDLTLVKGGTATGIIATTDLDTGIGSAAASATTLAGTMIDWLEKQDIDTDALSVDMEAHTLGQTTATFPKQQADGATNKLYLNLVAVGGITVDDTVTVSGYIDIYIIDLGNRTS